ncbi:hypothetical protein DFH27DRAFT_617766 [Peziza echinospora]|nr:hypothetical protein DFH27DRAFT_617766 [Peziza echinospora]
MRVRVVYFGACVGVASTVEKGFDSFAGGAVSWFHVHLRMSVVENDQRIVNTRTVFVCGDGASSREYGHEGSELRVGKHAVAATQVVCSRSAGGMISNDSDRVLSVPVLPFPCTSSETTMPNTGPLGPG